MEPLERRAMLSADAMFSISSGFEFARPNFDAAAYAAYLNEFDHGDHDGDFSSPQVEAFPLAPESAQGDGSAWENYDLSQTFELNSLAGADHVIYLDFDGHTTSGTLWNSNFNGGDDILTPAYDRDGNANSFSDSELANIQQIWAYVAEDFAPFNVNVTTEDPGLDRLVRSGGGDDQWGIRVVVGANTFYSSAGGVAYVGSFDWNSDTPTYVFNESVVGVAEAASHEAGHTLGLRHDGTSSQSYYSGHGSGDTSWGPIMGASYYRSLTQWSQGEYDDADRQEDDLNIISTQNGFGFRDDDFGNGLFDATSVLAAGESSFETTYGIIERNTDIDYFSFFAGAGTASIAVDTLAVGANLDVLASLYDSDGSLLAVSNPIGATGASFDFDLESGGQYFVSITGTGQGDPQTDGYTDYGSLGNYRITGSVEAYDGIIIQAAGTTNQEQMLLQIDGLTVATFDNVGGDADVGVFETYVYDASGITSDQVRIVFTNDLNDGDVDRNLRIDSVTIAGVVIETESNVVFSTGTWTEADGVQAGFGRGDTLHANGYFQFGQTPISIIVRAAGDEGFEQYSLQINGETIGTATVGTTFQSDTFAYAGTVSASDIRIVFAGDQYDTSNGIDTNLHVDWIDVDGTTFQTESASVFSTGTRVGGEVMPGFAQSETLHTDGYFQFGVTAPTVVDAIDGITMTRRRLSISLDSNDSPLIINLTDGTITNDGEILAIPDTIRRIVATGGAGQGDELFVVGTEAKDTITARPTNLRLRGGGITLTSRAFESTRAYASGDDDYAIVRGTRAAGGQLTTHDQTTVYAGEDFDIALYDFERMKATGVTVVSPGESEAPVEPIQGNIAKSDPLPTAVIVDRRISFTAVPDGLLDLLMLDDLNDVEDLS